VINGKRVLALIPARAGSKGLPNKNIRMLHGKPLLAWPVAAARGCGLVDDVMVSTDSAEYAEIAREHGADVPFLRPAELASDTAPSIDFILHALDTLAASGRAYHYVVLLEPTSPLTESGDIAAALAQLDAAGDAADAVVGVTRMETVHPAYCVTRSDRGLIAPHGSASFDTLPRRQDLEPVYALDGTLYISRTEVLHEKRSFCHSRTLGYVSAHHKHFEVDDLVDFICIEAVMTNLEAINRAR